MAPTRTGLFSIAGSVMATLLVTRITLNLMPVERGIEHRIERLYELGSPQFHWSGDVGNEFADALSERAKTDARVHVLLDWVGSTNFDVRSFRLNDETNLNVYDSKFAARQIEVFERDLAKSRRVTLEQRQARPWPEKLIERAAALLGPQL